MSPSPWPQATSGFSDAVMENCQTNPSPPEMLHSALCLHIPFPVNTCHRCTFRSGINNLSPILPHLCACSPENFRNCFFAFKYHAAPLAFHCLNVSRFQDDIVWRRMDWGGVCKVQCTRAMACSACLTSPVVKAGSGSMAFCSTATESWVQAR